MKKALALTLTAIGLASLSPVAQAQMYVGSGGQPTIEVNLDVLDSLPPAHAAHGKRNSRATRVRTRATHQPATRTFRDNSGEMVSYTGGNTGPMTYEQAVHMAGGSINNGSPFAEEADDGIEAMPLNSPSSSRTSSSTHTAYSRSGVHAVRGSRPSRHSLAEEAGDDTVDNLNRLAVECSAGNMLARGESASVIPVADTMPMAPPVTSAGATAIPTSIIMPRNPVPATPSQKIRATPQPVGLPDTPAVASTPLPPTPSIQTTAIPADIPSAPPPISPGNAPSAPALPPPMMPTPVSMTAPPVPARLMPDDLKIDFAPNSEALPNDASMHLSRLAAKLNASPELRVELRSFATGSADMASKARRLALARALSVRSYLTGQGIDPERIDVRALGNSANAAPGDRVDIFLTR
jgi:outer membrane protein OmpA-like peptidoglycan-associated protein